MDDKYACCVCPSRAWWRTHSVPAALTDLSHWPGSPLCARNVLHRSQPGKPCGRPAGLLQLLLHHTADLPPSRGLSGEKKKLLGLWNATGNEILSWWMATARPQTHSDYDISFCNLLLSHSSVRFCAVNFFFFWRLIILLDFLVHMLLLKVSLNDARPSMRIAESYIHSSWLQRTEGINQRRQPLVLYSQMSGMVTQFMRWC